MTEPLDIRTPEGARAWGDLAAHRFVSRYPHHAELADARLAPSADALTGEAFEAFALAFMQGTAEQLAATRAYVLTDYTADEREELEAAVAATLRFAHEGHAIGQQEAARQALFAAVRYGLEKHALQAAERLFYVQCALVALGIRLSSGRPFDAFHGDA